MINVAIVDDRPREARNLADDLAARGLRFELYEPPTNPAAHRWLSPQPDFIVIDLNLFDHAPAHGTIDYRGSTLATTLRDHYPTTPIVIATRQSLGAKSAPLRDVPGSFDDVWFKERVEKDPEEYRAALRSLVAGYRALARAKQSLDGVYDVLACPAAAKEELRLAELPVDLPTGSWWAPNLARWIRRTLLAYPGPLVDALFAATSVGMSQDEFESDGVARLMARARYRGAFETSATRWWASSVATIASQYFAKRGPPGGPRDFGRRWATHNGRTYEGPVCCVTTTTPADSVCWVLRRPVATSHSLPYTPDNRPPAMQQARISFKAIRENHESWSEAMFAPDARRMARELAQEQ